MEAFKREILQDFFEKQFYQEKFFSYFERLTPETQNKIINAMNAYEFKNVVRGLAQEMIQKVVQEIVSNLSMETRESIYRDNKAKKCMSYQFINSLKVKPHLLNPPLEFPIFKKMRCINISFMKKVKN